MHATRTARPVSAPRTRFWTSNSGRLWFAQAVLAVAYVGAAAPKLGNDPHLVAKFADLGVSAAGMHTIGVLEIAGAAGLLIPRLVGAVTLTVVHVGVQNAIAAAKEFAGERVVDVSGGQIGSQALTLGLIDQVVVNQVPVILGSGRPFFATGGLADPLRLRNPTAIVPGDRVTHLVYDVSR